MAPPSIFRYAGSGWRDTTNATDASPRRKPELPDWNGRHASNGGRSTNNTPRSTKCRMLSVVPDTSVATTMTSVTTPASSHILAVSMAALPEAHIAVTDMAGPWKPCRCIAVDRTVDGMSWRYSRFVR